MRLLFVCAGNLCRSPVAERLVRASVQGTPGADASSVTVTSAGLVATPDQPMHPYSADALVARGGDPEGFLSRRFEPDMAVQADLVITMTRSQRREVLLRHPRGLRHTFTLREAARLLQHADLTGLGDLPVEDRARELAVRLDAARRHAPSSAADDIADPIDGGPHAHRAATAAVAEALQPVLALLLPARTSTPEAPTAAPRPRTARPSRG